MEDLRPRREVLDVMRQEFGSVANIPPNTITADAMLYAPPPPADNLNLTTERVEGLILLCATRLLGRNMTTMFQREVIPPQALTRDRFGPLADLVHIHFNSLALSGAFLAVCEGQHLNPHRTTPATPLEHPDMAARLSFMRRVEDFVRDRICETGAFEFTITRAGELMSARNVGTAMDVTIGGIRDALDSNGCI